VVNGRASDVSAYHIRATCAASPPCPEPLLGQGPCTNNATNSNTTRGPCLPAIAQDVSQAPSGLPSRSPRPHAAMGVACPPHTSYTAAATCLQLSRLLRQLAWPFVSFFVGLRLPCSGLYVTNHAEVYTSCHCMVWCSTQMLIPPPACTRQRLKLKVHLGVGVNMDLERCEISGMWITTFLILRGTCAQPLVPSSPPPPPSIAPALCQHHA
jgi:hypothetical protein